LKSPFQRARQLKISCVSLWWAWITVWSGGVRDVTRQRKRINARSRNRQWKKGMTYTASCKFKQD
jgi:hypothetical protein